MVVSVGRLRPDPVYDVRFTLLVHNTMRGAAGAALLNAELAVATGAVGSASRQVATTFALALDSRPG